MRERSEMLLKLACLAVAALFLYRLGRAFIGGDPLAHLTIPDLPSLPAVPGDSPGGKGTNLAPVAASGGKGTNNPARPSGMTTTNPPTTLLAEDTNKTAASPQNTVITNTNALLQVAEVSTNIGSTVLSHGSGSTNTNSAPRIAASGTNSVSSGELADKATNAASPGQLAKKGTNSPQSQSGKKATNSPSRDTAPTAIDSNPRAMAGKKAADLPPAIQARVERITDSEILGPVVRPLPMGLLGIAGNVAFLRAPSGQTGLVKEGDELGGLKLLRIGINRVLIEQDGQKKELTLFSGYGGDSLLPKPKDTSNETTNR